MVDDCDPCEWYSAVIRKARKVHNCSECNREIKPKESYERVASMFEGSIGSYKTCIHCIEARKWLIRECSGFLHLGIEEDLLEHWHEDDIHTMELGRILIGMKNQWLKKNGQLMPLPKVKSV